MKEIRLLITSVGGLVAPEIINSLRHSFHSSYIIGIDSNLDAVGFHFVDKKYVVFPGTSDQYCNQVLEIAKKEKIDIILPLSDEEVLALSKEKSIFEEKGIKIICSSFQSTEISSDKALLFQYLQSKNLPYAEYKLPKNISDLKKMILELGYPNKKVVIKPRKARGARGFCIIDPHIDKYSIFFEERDRQKICLEWLLDSFSERNNLSEYVLMEYLPGKDFNIDVLCWKGEPLYIIPNERIVPNAGPLQVGLIKKNKQIVNLIKEVITNFNFDYYVNIEVAYTEEKNPRPLIYEINPRASAPIISNKAAGIDILKMGIDLAMNIEIDKNKKFSNIKMARYWKDLFIKI